MLRAVHHVVQRDVDEIDGYGTDKGRGEAGEPGEQQQHWQQNEGCVTSS